MDSYFQGFGKEPLNPQESIRERTHLVTIYLKDEFFLIRIILKSTFFKILRECNMTNESQIHDIRGNIFQGNALRPSHRN